MSENSNTNDDSSLNLELENFQILPDDFTEIDLNFKVIVIGDAGVGKTCITKKGIKNTFADSYNPTIGFEFLSFIIKLSDKKIRLQIWDTCGQEAYRSLVTNFYRNSSLAIMVYSIDDRKSFENIDIWLKEMRTYSNPDVKIFLIGNKNDLEKKRKVDKEEGELYTKNNNIDLFMESSAKNGFNTQKLFIEASKILYKDYLMYKNKQKNKNKVESKNDEKNKLKNDDDKKKSSCC